MYRALEQCRDSVTEGRDLARAVFAVSTSDYRDLLVASLVAAAVALVGGVAAFGLLLSVDTGVRAAQYAAGWHGGSNPVFQLQRTVQLLLLAVALGRLPFVFFDLPVLFGDVSATRGWLASLRFARHRPVRFGRYLLGRLLLVALLVGAPWMAFTALKQPASDSLGWLMLALGALALASVGTVLVPLVVAAYHVDEYDASVGPWLASSDGSSGTPVLSGAPLRRAALVAVGALLVVGLVAGSVGVRMADARPAPDDTHPVDSDAPADAVAANALSLAARTGHVAEQRVYTVNGSTETERLTEYWRATVDHADRQIALTIWLVHDDEDAVDGRAVYAGESAFAMARFDTSRVGAGGPSWTGQAPIPSPGYAVLTGFHEEKAVFFPRVEGREWRYAERRDDTVVLVSSNRTVSTSDGGRTVTRTRTRLVVDRDTGRAVRSAVSTRTVEYASNGSVVERTHTRRDTTYSNYGGVDLRRPEALGGRRPMAWLWDLVYY